jgi:hypothetical protein
VGYGGSRCGLEITALVTTLNASLIGGVSRVGRLWLSPPHNVHASEEGTALKPAEDFERNVESSGLNIENSGCLEGVLCAKDVGNESHMVPTILLKYWFLSTAVL